MNLPPGDPRAFVRGVGLVFQIAGMSCLLGGCCIGSFSGLIQGPSVEASGFRQWLTQSPPGQVIAAVNIVVTCLAGLALAVFGMGLQHERAGGAVGAAVTTGVLALSWAVTTTASFLAAPALLRILLQLLFLAASVVLFLLALAARRELQLNPPPAAAEEPVTPEFLEQFDLHRRAQREIEDAAAEDQ
jgi:hypothetical protein